MGGASGLLDRTRWLTGTLHRCQTRTATPRRPPGWPALRLLFPGAARFWTWPPEPGATAAYFLSVDTASLRLTVTQRRWPVCRRRIGWRSSPLILKAGSHGRFLADALPALWSRTTSTVHCFR